MFAIVASESRLAFRMPRRSPPESVIAGAFHCDVRAGAHGDADIGRRQRRRVVDAVAGHGDHPPLAAQALHDVRLALGQDLGLHVVDPELSGDRLRRRAVVAGQHDDADALALQGRDRPRRSSP